MDYSIKSNLLELYISTDLYSESIIFKCFYWYTVNYDVDIRMDLENRKCIITLACKQEIDFDNLVSKIKKDLIDFKLRDIVTHETKVVRELIIAKAFSYYDDTIAIIGEVSDPVGFSPGKIM